LNNFDAFSGYGYLPLNWAVFAKNRALLGHFSELREDFEVAGKTLFRDDDHRPMELDVLCW